MATNPIQWFPGHMAKTRRMMKECLGEVDIILELLDARIPYSSKNPEIEKLIGNKPKITISLLLTRVSARNAAIPAFEASNKTVRSAKSLRPVWSTLVAPMLPEPILRISPKPHILVRTSPKGIEPSKYPPNPHNVKIKLILIFVYLSFCF